MATRRIFNPQMQNAIQILGGLFSTRKIEKMLREGLTPEAQQYLARVLAVSQRRSMEYIQQVIDGFAYGDFIASHATINKVVKGKYHPKQEWTRP